MKCPICEAEFSSQSIKEWSFGPYYVSRYKCTKCGELFNLYEAEGKKSFTIPKPT